MVERFFVSHDDCNGLFWGDSCYEEGCSGQPKNGGCWLRRLNFWCIAIILQKVINGRCLMGVAYTYTHTKN
jgi:hypothetical protein